MKLTEEYLQACLSGTFEHELLTELAQVAQYKQVAVGAYLIRPGEYIRSVPIIIRGSVKIMRPDQEGRAALLYYLGELDTCAMSLNSRLTGKPSEITAVADEETELIVIPLGKVDDWMRQYNTWKQFVWQTYQKRFDALLHTVDEVIFHRLDERLLAYIQKKIANCQCSVLSITHQEIAQELATSREVISRLLKQLEKNGQIKLMRNQIALSDDFQAL